MTTLELVKSFVEKNQIKEAIETFLMHSTDKNSKDIARVLAGRLKDINEKLIIGVISQSKASKENTRIAHSLLKLANESNTNSSSFHLDPSLLSLEDKQLNVPVFNQSTLLELIYAFSLREPDQWISSKPLQDHFKVDYKTLSYSLLQLKEKELIQVKFLLDRSLVKITADGLLILME